MKFKHIKLANSVKIGTKEHVFISKTLYDVELKDNFIVQITEKLTGATSFTTLFNTIYWEADEPSADAGQPAKAPKSSKV